MPGVLAEGEYSLFLFGGRYSHAIVKRPAAGDFRVQPQFGGREEIWTASAAARSLAESALAAAPAATIYARVDMIGDGRGGLAIMELELIEPQLFLNFAPDSGAAFGAAVAGRCSPANHERPIRQPLSRHSHWRIADVRFGGSSASIRSTSIRATRALTGRARRRASASSASQNIGSRLIEVG